MNQSINYANHLKAISNISALPLDLCNIISRYVIDHIINIQFIHASKYGHLEVVKFLHKDVNISTYSRNLIRDAIHEAIEYGHLEVVKYLHCVGAKIVAEFQDACIYGHLEIVKYIMSSENIDSSTIDKAIVYAAEYSHFDIVKVLYSAGADLTAHNSRAFVRASSEGDLDIVIYILEVSPACFIESQTAVNLAARYGHLDVVEFLHVKGADISEAYHGASWNGHYNVLDYLWENSAYTAQ
jgi:ankyrin repeat protein